MKSKLLATLLICCTLPVWVGAQVTPQGTFSGNTICPGGQARLTFTATAGNGPFTVRYTDGNAIRTQTGVSSGVAFNALSNTTATKTYTLLHVTGADMGGRSSGFTDASAQVTVFIRPDLKNLSLAPIAPVCAGSDASLTLNGFVEAQGFETQSAITTSANGANSVYAADLDGDGDLDVLSSSNLDNKIAWYQNNGSGTFTAQPNISTTVDAAAPVHAADLDGDGDIDVVTGSYSNAKIKWYKNDGTGNFTEQPTISSPGASVAMVHTADMDGDGDMDVLSCTLNNRISWYKNDGTGNFGPQHLISTSVNLPYSIYAADLDGDGDMDVLSASSDDDKVAWYKNDGSGNFDLQLVISTSANGARAVHAADLDSDGDMDVLSGSVYDDKIVWYKNDGSGAFIEQTPISTSADAPLSVRAADLDGDGDLDVLSASVLDHKIAWYKNDGSGVFTTQTAISTSANGAAFVHTADLDSDGDLDVLSASTGDDKIAWYENRMPFSGNVTVTYNISGGTSQTASAPVSTGMATLTIPTPSTGTLNLTKIANANSCETGTSSSVSLTVISPGVGGTVGSVQTICSGTSPADLNLSGQTGDVVKWQKASDANFSTPIDIASTATLTTLPSALIGNLTADTYFRAVVQSGVCSEVNSSSVLITVNPVSVGGTASSVQTICSGTSPADLSLSGQTGDVVKWQKSSDANFSTPVDIASTATLTTLPSAVIGALTADTYFRAVVQSGVCSEAISSSVKITVNPVSVGGVVSSAQTICSSTSPADLNLSGQTGSVVKWQKSSDANFSTPVDIASTATLTTLPSTTIGNLTANTYFRAVVQSGVCSEVFSSSALITVNVVSVGGVVSSAQTICSSTSPADLSLSGQTGSVVKWQKSSDANFSTPVDIASTATLTTLPSAVIGALTADTYFRAVVQSGVCSEAISSSVKITVNPVSVGGTVSLAQTICLGTSPADLSLSGQTGSVVKWQKSSDANFSTPVDIASTATLTTLPSTTIGNLTANIYFRAVVQSGVCSEAYSSSALIQIHRKPTITLSTLQQTLVEGNNQTFCDTDANPVNSLQFNVSGLCVSGSPVWRVQVGSGAWSAWSATAPVSQPSNNQPHRYQAACDASCTSTYSGVIELTINNRATVPQNVSLLVDGVTVLVGESKEVCSLTNSPMVFNANCAAGEVTLYSVDGGEYSSGVPIGLVDNQYHNYRVRCRKSDGTPSCVESESGVMRLKLVTIPSAPTVSLSSTSSCDATASFSGQSSCGSLRTVWYNATTNVALPNLPSTVPSQTTSYYARCQTENGCVSEKSNVVTFTLTPTQVAPVITASQEIVCTGTSVTISANCPAGSQTFWNTGVTTPSFEVSFNNVTKQTYWAKCIFGGGCQSSESIRKDIYWNAFVVTLINVGESKSSVKVNDRAAWTSQFITRDGGPELEQSTQQNPTLYFVENANKIAPRYWTINVEACGLSTDGSLTFDMLATPEMGVIRSFNTHENNAPYFMYANREGWTELYAQNHPAYGFYQDNGAGGNAYDAGLPKGLYKLGVRYWDQKGWGSIYPSTRKPQGNVLAYQEYWFRIQSKDGVGIGAARTAEGSVQGANNSALVPPMGARGLLVLPNPVTNLLRLQVQDSKGQAVQTTLTDASGREVLNRQFVPETNSHQEEFGVQELPMGMYFLKVSTSDRQATLKVVKVN